MAVQQAETTFYEDRGVLVTNTRAVLGDTTYPLANISSVGVGRHVPSAAPGIVLALLAVGALLCGVVSQENLIAGLVGAALFGALALLAFQGTKPSYYVRIASAGGEQQALAGRDKAEVEKIVAALNQAIVARG